MHYSNEQTEERFKIAPQMTDIISLCPRRSVEHTRLIVSLISETHIGLREETQSHTLD